MQPMAEVFGFPITDLSPEADRHKANRLCPFNNKSPNCTKAEVENPLGVCSIFHGERVTITCPIRFRQGWQIVSDAAQFFFPGGVNYTSLTEVRLNDADGKSAGNIDLVLVTYDDDGQVLDFGALEVQAVYVSGNIRRPFTSYTKAPSPTFDWRGHKQYPRPDFLSSSRKRLAPQLIYKGGILHSWKKKMAVAVDEAFFATLPAMPMVDAADADIAWLIYDLTPGPAERQRQMMHTRTIYTQFTPALSSITTSRPGEESTFRRVLQQKLTLKLRPSAQGVDLEDADDVTVEED